MSSLMVFPGQGAQQVGMLHQLPDEPQVRAHIALASEVLAEDVLALDSAAALRSTRAVQLALLIAGVACARLLIERSCAPDYVAGLSIGAYAAAVVAGALEFADAVRLVALRAELMQNAYPSGFGMTAIVGLDLTTLEALLARVHRPHQPVYLANINAANQLVIAGSHSAMGQVAALARAQGAGMCKALAVSVPSHCPLLAEPARQLQQAFADIPMQRPAIGYLSGSSARLLSDPERLRDDLAGNMGRIVDWHSTLQTAYERGVRLHIELPPGAVLSVLARRVFVQGTVLAFQGNRLDSLGALLRQEVGRRS
ncbi:malonate decarboxylase epsilon subunit [Pseudomonas sp. TE3786]